jgi:hypothetical protein
MEGSGLVLAGLTGGSAAAVTLTEPAAVKETAPFARAFAASVSRSPGVAVSRTYTWTCSSSGRPDARSPSAQVAPVESGQTENCGTPVPSLPPIEALTVTSLVLAPTLQTQTA